MRQSVKWALALGLSLGTGIAVAQVTYRGSYNIPLATGTESYLKQSPTSGTLSFQTGMSEMQIGGGTTITALTIALNPTPYDGQVNCFYTKPAITTLTLTKPSTTTLNDAVTAASATTRYCYIYSASNTSWDRVQ